MIDLEKLIGMIKAFVWGIAICLALTCLHSCRTTHKITEEIKSSTESYASVDSTKVDSSAFRVTTSVSTSNWETDISEVVEEYSSPDSLGNQFLMKRTTTTKHSHLKSQGEAKDSSVVNYSKSELKADTGEVCSYSGKTTTKDTKSSDWKLYASGILIVVFIIFVLLVIKFKLISKFFSL